MRIGKILLLCVCLLSFGVKAQRDYKVTFFIHDYQYDSIYIEGYEGGDNIMLDSVGISKDGGFHTTLKDCMQGMYMVKSKKGDMFSFLLDRDSSFTIEVYQDGEFFVENSPQNDAYFLYQRENKKVQMAMYYYRIKASAKDANVDSLRKDIMEVMDSFERFQESFFHTYPNNLITVITMGMNQSAPSYFFENGKLKQGKEKEYAYYYRQHYWDKFHFEDIRILYSPYFIKQFDTYISEITPQQVDSICLAIDEFVKVADKRKGREYADYVLTWYMQNLSKLPFSFNEVIYTNLANKYMSRLEKFLLPSVVEYHKETVKNLTPFLPNKQMPNIVLRDFKGNTQSLYSVKHKYTVLYFFSTSCESCKKDLEDLKRFYKEEKEKYDVEIYSIDVEPDYAICKARQEADPYEWIVTHASKEELDPYNFNLNHTPTLYVLDENKKVINKTAIYDHVGQTIKIDYENKQIEGKK